MASASDVARYIIRFLQEAGDPPSNLKLQKLLYYCQGWHLAVRGERLFPEPLQAWVHGPVQPAVYGAYKHKRWSPIDEDVKAPVLMQSEAEVLDEVLAVYGGDPAYQLERRTHTEMPWLLARNGIPDDQESTAEITVDSMSAYFKSLMQ